MRNNIFRCCCFQRVKSSSNFEGLILKCFQSGLLNGLESQEHVEEQSECRQHRRQDDGRKRITMFGNGTFGNFNFQPEKVDEFVFRKREI